MSSRFQQCSGIESSPLQDEIILFHSPSNKFCVLNRTSSFIWSQIQQPRTPEEIVRQLSASFSEVNEADASRDVDVALREMVALGLAVAIE